MASAAPSLSAQAANPLLRRKLLAASGGQPLAPNGTGSGAMQGGQIIQDPQNTPPDYGSFARSIGQDPTKSMQGGGPLAERAQGQTVGAPPSVSSGSGPSSTANPTSGNTFNPFNQRDVYNQNQDIGKNQYQEGQDWNNNYGQLADYYNQQGAGATQNVNNLYNPIWGGGGGYTDQMKSDVQDNQGLSDVTGANNDNFLTGAEQTSIAGSPYAASDAFKGQAQSLMQGAGDYNSRISGQAGSAGQAGQGILGNYKSSLDSAIDPTALGVSAGYKSGMDATLATGAAGLKSAQGDPGLYDTADYERQAGMTDQEVQDTATAAARGVGASYGAAKDDLLQRANAAGTASPLGIAAARNSLERNSAADQADALTNARLAARGQQRDAATGVQNTQLSSAQYRAGLGSQNTLAQENADLAANASAEQLRLGANQGIADRRINAANTYGSAALSENNTAADRNIAASTAAANYGKDIGEYNATTSSNLIGQGESNASNRATSLANSRVGANQGNQQTNLNVSNQRSGRAVAANQPWVNAQTEGRSAAQSQQQYFGNQGNAQSQLRLGGAQTYGQGAQNAANAYSQWGQNETNNGGAAGAFRNTTNLLGALASGSNAASNGKNSGMYERGGAVDGLPEHGGMIDHHQTIEVGEHDRPEAILPLDPMTEPSHMNPWEKMGAQLGKALGIHHPERADEVDYEHPHMLESMGIMRPKKHYFTGGMASGDQQNQPQMVNSPQFQAQGSMPTTSPIPSSSMPNYSPLSIPQGTFNAGQQNSPQQPQAAPAPMSTNTPYKSTPMSTYTEQAQPTSMPTQQSSSSTMTMPGGMGMQQQYKQPSQFDLGADNSYTHNLNGQEGMQQPRKPWQPPAAYKRGGMIGQGAYRMNIGRGFHMPELRTV